MSSETTSVLRPPSERMRELDFLLGHHRCVGRAPEDGSAPTVMYMHGRPTLGGHYYNVDFTWPGVMSGRWIFGWNPVDEEYNVYYLADSGTQGTAASAGWSGDEFQITGEYSVAEMNAHRAVRDVFSRGDESQFVTHSYVRSEEDGRWILLDVFEAHRITAEQAREENPDARH
ncbi:DUF1579 family protein [Streptomyces sp. HNM0575]|uniref:DUF1579 family protein n=1 Tax=Streptomyces sp. HNM0575 TaxID=2716338 RepID=UPI00145EE0F6|nr:DUF1579 family protein [Streptomyces sp. HNM0575]NLU76576.1 DUF1579 family protein [Streptomyces sp. HNM0575]